MAKNHIIKSFRVSLETFRLFKECIERTGLSNSDLRRMLFNRALHQLILDAREKGWENLTFLAKEFK